MYLFYVIGHSVQLAGSQLPVLGLDSCLAVEALRLSHRPAREVPAPSLSPQQTSVFPQLPEISAAFGGMTLDL